MSEELKPCPFCGATCQISGDSEIAWVACSGPDGCRAEGPSGDTEAEATRRWNTRKDAP